MDHYAASTTRVAAQSVDSDFAPTSSDLIDAGSVTSTSASTVVASIVAETVALGCASTRRSRSGVGSVRKRG